MAKKGTVFPVMMTETNTRSYLQFDCSYSLTPWWFLYHPVKKLVAFKDPEIDLIYET
jgi:hypothetical protein